MTELAATIAISTNILWIIESFIGIMPFEGIEIDSFSDEIENDFHLYCDQQYCNFELFDDFTL